MKAVKATLLLTHITFAPMCENRSGHTFYAKRTTHGQTHTLMPECCITDKEWGINRGWRQRQRRKFAVSRITSKHLIMASTHGRHDWLRRGRGATSEGVMPSSLKWRGKDGSTQRAAVFQLHNNKATGDVTLARRTYGKRVVLERWQTSKCDLEMSVKGRIDGNDTWGGHPGFVSSVHHVRLTCLLRKQERKPSNCKAVTNWFTTIVPEY